MRTQTIARALARTLAAGLVAPALLVVPAAVAHAATGSPIGNVDTVSAVDGGIRVTGWAYDPDTTAAVTVTIAAGAKTVQVKASGTRTDVARAVPEAGSARGFDTVLAVGAGSHQVCVTAIDVGVGSDKVFPCRAVTVGSSSVATASTTATTTGALPAAGNTGVPAGTTLKRHDGDLVITTPNAVISGLDVRGFVDVRASGVTIKNSVIRGRSVKSPTALVAVRSSAYSLTIQDSELIASTASPYVDGLHGMNITARRLEIAKVIDSVHIYGNNVLVESSWLHANAHFTSDPRWGGKPSHDDSVQIQRGANITLRNNNISGSHSAAVMLTQDSGAVSNLKVAGNLLDGGTCVVNVKKMASAPTKVSITDNKFGRHAIYPNCGVKIPTSYPLDLQRNFFTDGKTVVRVW